MINSITTEVVNLTPELAAEWLRTNKSNRVLSESTVMSYSKAIQRGEWMMNGEPIIFFSDNTLGNGQHRLHAVVRANVPIQTMVVRGVQNMAFKTIDGGKKRTAADVLGIGGESHAIGLAAAARAFIVYHATGREAFMCITSQQIEECVATHPELRFG